MEMNDVNSRVHTDNMSVSRTDVDEMSGGSAIHLRPYHSMLLYENCTRSLQNLVYLLYNSATSTISSSTIASASASSDIAITSSIVQSESIETSNRESDTKEFLMLPDIYKLFIQSIKPTSTFLELANTLELTLKDVYALATELETLGIGRVIKVVTEDSVYKVHPHADLSSEGLLCHMFTAAFPFNGIELKLHRQPSWVSMTMLQPNGHSELNSDGSRSKSTVSVSNIVPRMSSINGFTASNTPASSSFHRHQSPLSLLNNSNHNNSTNSMQKPRSDDLSVKFTLPNAEQQSTTRNQSIKPFGQIQMNNQSSGSPAALDFLPAISSRYGDSALNTNATNTARYSNINTSRTTNTARIEVESPRSDYQTNRSSTDNLSMKSVFTASGKTIADTGRAPSRPDDEYTLATGRSWAQLSDTRDRVSNVPPQSLRRSVGLSEVTVGSTSVFFYVLSLFDGATNVSRYIDKLPGSLKAVSVDILIWLLRFNILQEVQISFVSIDSLSNEPSAHVMTSNTDENRMVSKDDPIEQRNTHSHSVELSELMWRQNLTEGKLRREHVMSALKGKEQVKIETLVSSIQSN